MPSSRHNLILNISRIVEVDNEEEIDVMEVSGDFFLSPENDKIREESRTVSGMNSGWNSEH